TFRAFAPHALGQGASPSSDDDGTPARRSPAMTTEAKIGHGTLFQINLTPGNSPDQWDTVAEVTSVTPPSLARDTVDATHNQSTDKWREFIAGLRDGGEASVELNFVPGGSGTNSLFDAIRSDDPVGVRIVFPDSPPTTWQFQALITAF